MLHVALLRPPDIRLQHAVQALGAGPGLSGCVFRSKGGMALQAMLPASVDMLTALARAAPEAGRQPFLHSLWLIAISAGLAFVPHVRVTSLSLAANMLTA